MSKKEIVVDGVVYEQRQEKKDGERLIIGIIDNRGLTYIGYSDLKTDDNGFILIRSAQCIIKWWTGAHINHLVNGVCDGVELGASSDVYVKELVQYIEPNFDTLGEWKSKKIPKGSKECL